LSRPSSANSTQHPLDIGIRLEQPEDYAATEALALAAFAPDVRVPELVRKLRASPSLIPELNLVAQAERVIVGHLMFSRANLVSESGSEIEVALLSPLGVLPGYQRRNVGSSLVRHALRWLEASSFPLIVLEGIPSYYPRFGFTSAHDMGIEPPYPVVKPAWQAYRLPAYDHAMRGAIVYPKAFDFLHPDG
jgi:putative acetyltransferase